MEQILLRQDAPLSLEQWELVDRTVQRVAGRILVGRKFLTLYGPVGFGAYTVPLYTYQVEEGEPVRAQMTRQVPLTLIQNDFIVTAQELALFNTGQPFDIAPVAAAASFCAYAEDGLIFQGLLEADGPTATLNDWSQEGQGLADVAQAVAALAAQGVYGPYVVVMHPLRYAGLQRVAGRQGLLEVELVARVVEGGLYQTPAIPEDRVLLLSADPRYLDLAVGQDLVTAFVETADMEHRFRVLEKVALRVKEARGICRLEPA